MGWASTTARPLRSIAVCTPSAPLRCYSHTASLSRLRPPTQIEAAATWDSEAEQWTLVDEELVVALRPVRLPSTSPACLLRRSLVARDDNLPRDAERLPRPPRTTVDAHPEAWAGRKIAL